jgi:hypothetical protein
MTFALPVKLCFIIRKTKGILSSYFLLLDQKKVTKKTQAFLTGLLLCLIISETQKRV